MKRRVNRFRGQVPHRDTSATASTNLYNRKGRDEHHPEDRYYLEWYEDCRRHREPVAPFDLVLAAARAKPPLVPSTTRITIAAAVDKYLEYIKVQRSLRTYRTYRPALSPDSREPARFF